MDGVDAAMPALRRNAPQGRPLAAVGLLAVRVEERR